MIYFPRSYGEKPRLSLSTVDGALLSGMDPISLVLGDGMVLEARVLGYDNPPLTTRLQLASESLGIGKESGWQGPTESNLIFEYSS